MYVGKCDSKEVLFRCSLPIIDEKKPCVSPHSDENCTGYKTPVNQFTIQCQGKTIQKLQERIDYLERSRFELLGKTENLGSEVHRLIQIRNQLEQELEEFQHNIVVLKEQTRLYDQARLVTISITGIPRSMSLRTLACSLGIKQSDVNLRRFSRTAKIVCTKRKADFLQASASYGRHRLVLDVDYGSW